MEDWKKEGTLANVLYRTVMEELSYTGNIMQTAKKLGIGRSTMYRWLSEWGITEDVIRDLRKSAEREIEVAFGSGRISAVNFPQYIGAKKNLAVTIDKPRERSIGKFSKDGSFGVTFVPMETTAISKEHQFDTHLLQAVQLDPSKGDNLLEFA